MRNFVGVLSLVAVVMVACVPALISTAGKGTALRQFHPNGRMATEEFIGSDGTLRGNRRCWDSNGRLLYSQVFDHGQVIRSTSYNPDGSVKLDRREGRDFRLIPVFD